MPVDDRVKLARAYSAASALASKAGELLALTGTVPANQITQPIDQIVRAYNDSIVPVIAFGEVAVNAAAARQFPINSPANTFTALQSLQSAVTTFLNTYKPIHDGAGNLSSFSATAGHTPVGVNTAALASLGTPLNNIVTAATPLVLDA